ncbi:MAG: hypothetical protein A2312_04490 [Candidatus Staskawiczbacteria bacterium RIFOXYB2_FULL_32_9]|uniref:Uncharacterized protein n=1 Tax=Candidatus Staskawiczbacteria bacterium RIFOXYD1_FULL_32_13 TaxID=1802234 RepID=A0A1G2JPW0_9BACT|nr:MAG: hypothetical protein UR22_C0019G0014 [Parcubacteria group bacterium GW2011_GWC2_32_10]OGZ80537.1 MAG: hypothetical protein A2360_03245 [Candidatus Staskawiczbacteria bacterium RIFOXYB1_FULL_32_11]OGZ83671.1 MAG: hypothetical protein A2312_04490 [Candidatus Staskawiczbacteria bacterium RIFOXYB2_FULL_32_9]OGZ87538.1 MAG: hypothetical protein A2463_03320 [Candidatus Staskawiczbacteria bacterium RIFOXYC2_FULL_32_10]OGZ89177.1 MAG: hypothetical protein A2561_01145 [Candidatus Staskawiczbacte
MSQRNHWHWFRETAIDVVEKFNNDVLERLTSALRRYQAIDGEEQERLREARLIDTHGEIEFYEDLLAICESEIGQRKVLAEIATEEGRVA